MRMRPSLPIFFCVAVLCTIAGAYPARAVDRATIELQLIWGTNDQQSPDPSQKPVEASVEKLLASPQSPYRWKHYFVVNRKVEEIASDVSKDKIAMSAHCEMDIKYLGKNRIQVKLYGDGKLLSTQREGLPLLLAGDAKNDTAWMVLIRIADTSPGSRSAALVQPQEAQLMLNQFRQAYSKLGNPRIVILVNRPLLDAQSRLRLSNRTERVETTRTTANSASATNTSLTTRNVATSNYRDTGAAAPTLADLQTMRDVERLVGEPFHLANATIVDASLAANANGDLPADPLERERVAAGKVADIAIEVLISSRKAAVQELSGNKTYNLPDLQVTAIRLKDARVIGQASASEVINRAGGDAVAARNFSPNEIILATAYALLDDITAEAK